MSDESASYTCLCMGCSRLIERGSPCTIWEGFTHCNDQCVERHKKERQRLSKPVSERGGE
jgi:hypothetical protein